MKTMGGTLLVVDDNQGVLRAVEMALSGQFDRVATLSNPAATAPPPPSPQGEPMFWGRSGAMADLRALVEKVAPTDANILITGENGTGKEVLAREIHRLSRRAGSPFEQIDMGAITETLFESELFGYEPGAFTDAKASKAGKMELAHGGTLLLDEIGNLSYPSRPNSSMPCSSGA